MRLFHTASGRALPLMTGSAAEFFRWMRGQKHLAVWMGLVRIRLIFKPIAINPDMTRLTAVYARQRSIKISPIELIEDDLLNSGDFGNGKAVEGEQHVGIQALLDPVPGGGELFDFL